MKNRLFLFLVLIAILFSAALGTFWFMGRGDGLTDRLQQKGLKTDFNRYKLSRETTHVVKEKPVTEWQAEADKNHLRVLVIENATSSFAQYVDQRVFDVNSQFNRGVSPYPGVVSQQNQCPEEFLPVVKVLSGAGWEGKLITTFANKRRQFGVCNEQEREFAVQNLLLLCPSRATIFDITIYSSLAGGSSFPPLPDMSCQ